MADDCLVLDNIRLLSNYSNKGNLACLVKSTADDKLLVSCFICTNAAWIKAQSLHRSVSKSWHKSYRCNKCVNVGRKYNSQHKKNIGSSLINKPLTELRKKNIGLAVSKSYKDNKGWNRKFYYNNQVFKSSYEVRFAQILDFKCIKWKYEYHIFYLEKLNKHYCPDFYLPDSDIFIEIKGYWRKDAKEKFDVLKEQLKDKLIVIDEKELLRIENER